METKINLLDAHVANLIAAGEVVDRPSSALKELIENSVDAGASIITVEIKNGGVSYMRVTDNGAGIEGEDLGKAVLRHATSKIKNEKDLAKINTLGFRGEALAAISSITDLKIFTKTKDSQIGYMLESSSGQNVKISEAGCANGTTVVIEKMFSKVPARQKFLKRDATEGMYCKWITEKMALSNPSVSFKFIHDGKQKIFAPGNGSLRDTIYSVFGDEVGDNMISIEPLDNTSNGGKMSVTGFISKIEDGRKTRAEENFFVNGRYVYSKTIMSALEEAYKSISEVSGTAGKFPFCVLYVNVDESEVDINVHPQKMEIKFSDEKQVYSSVYYAVKSALNKNAGYGDYYKKPEPPVQTIQSEPPVQPAQYIQPMSNYSDNDEYKQSEKTSLFKEYREFENKPKINIFDKDTVDVVNAFKETEEVKEFKEVEEVENIENIRKYNYKLIGEVFYGYIIIEKDDKVVVIDKHAAHERIIYDIMIKRAETVETVETVKMVKTQILLLPVEIKLNPKEVSGIYDIEQDMKKIGIVFEWISDDVISITEVPLEISDGNVNIEEIVKEAAYMSSEGNLSAHETAFEKLAELAATKYAACRAAMKSGIQDSPENIIWLADRVMNYEDVRYCPHGRPIAFELAKDDIEKRFKR